MIVIAFARADNRHMGLCPQTTWNAHSNLASVACAEECDAIKNDENQSACLSFSYDGSTTSQLEVEMAFAVLLSDTGELSSAQVAWPNLTNTLPAPCI